ncbi:MAG: GlxA family transcriptional regulator [Acidimicrobiales bacterium]
MRQTVLVLVPDGGSLFEIAAPIGVWGRDRSDFGGPEADLVVTGMGSSEASLDGPKLQLGGLASFEDWSDTADMIVIPTWPVDSLPIPEDLCEALRLAHQRGARIVGLCLGSFVVAASGLLDGMTAVTHWGYSDKFERLFPRVQLRVDPLYIDHGSVVTSAGSAAALDCCLHLVRVDHGTEAAAFVARLLVTAPHRSGGQAQFAAPAPIRPREDVLGGVLFEASADIGIVASVSDLAQMASMDRRSLERDFRRRLGVSPREWLTEQRIQSALRLLEQSGGSVEEVAEQSGFGSASSMRRHFRQSLGTTPTAYRTAFHLRD